MANKKWYGSVCNRIGEGRQYEEIKEGTDITMYYWSDRTCYFVTRVVDAKHIFVKQYEVVGDRSKPGGMGHQDWLYFKTRKEANQYLNENVDKKFLEKYGGYPVENVRENPEEEWVFRYGKWMEKIGDKQYRKLNGQVSFGIRDYHYDWEF